jgi:hypothetical protein
VKRCRRSDISADVVLVDNTSMGTPHTVDVQCVDDVAVFVSELEAAVAATSH